MSRDNAYYQFYKNAPYVWHIVKPLKLKSVEDGRVRGGVEEFGIDN